MKNTKLLVTPFTFYDRTGIQKMLEKQAQKGWLLEKIGPFFWKYRRIQPKKLHFAVTYLPKVSQFDPTPNLAEEAYQDFVSQSGWKFAASTAQLQIFYHEGEDPVPIETDAVLEVENIHKTMKKSLLPGYFLMLVVIFLNLGTRIPTLLRNPINTLCSNAALLASLSMVLLIAAELVEIGGYYRWYFRARKAAKLDGSFVETRGRGKGYALLLLACFGLLWLASTGLNQGFVKAMLLYAVGLIAVSMGVRWLLSYWKRHGMEAGDNFKYSMILVAVGAVILMQILSANVTAMTQETFPGESYEYNGQLWFRYTQPVPLNIPELTGDAPENYSTRTSVEESVFLKRTSVTIDAIQSIEKGKDLQYEVLDIKLPQLYELCLDSWLNMYQDPKKIERYGNTYTGEFRPMNPSPWGAESAYQLYRMDKPRQQYILCFEDWLIYITFNWEPTPEQMALVGSALTNEQNFDNIENK